MISELKRELSRLSGIDFFNPKFRDVFKKYLPEEKDAEEERAEEVLEEKGIEPEEINEPVAESEEKAEEVKEEAEKDDKAEEIEEDIEKAEDEREIDKIEEEKADSDEKKDEKAEEVNEESEEIGKKVDEEKADYEDELFDTRLELALVRNNVRDDKLETAKDYLKYKLNDRDLAKVVDILKEFPEWTKKDKNEPKAFGMSVDESGDGLTEEEKHLKALGIDPKN